MDMSVVNRQTGTFVKNREVWRDQERGEAQEKLVDKEERQSQPPVHIYPSCNRAIRTTDSPRSVMNNHSG